MKFISLFYLITKGSSEISVPVVVALMIASFYFSQVIASVDGRFFDLVFFCVIPVVLVPHSAADPLENFGF